MNELKLDNLKIDVSSAENDVALVAIDGEITFDNAAQLRDSIDKICDKGICNIVIDLKDLKYMSSAGLGVLVHGLKNTRNKGGDLRVVNLNGKMKRVFVITQFTHHFKVYDTLEQAIASFAKTE
ncbi:MAG: STAS domain-containing protein [Candidatus Riflebacteria bacterium]|nr:STAS domain-containing protein [Candidatus Riflebacteria bacterium]